MTTHGMSRTRVYMVWQSMKSRCCNREHVDYKNYGARGIRVCARWQTFENFLEDMSLPAPGETIERLNNDGHYGPDNCTWATRSRQGSNKRNNNYLELHGKRQTLSQWARETGLSRGVIWKRMQKQWPMEKVLSPLTGIEFMRKFGRAPSKKRGTISGPAP